MTGSTLNNRAPTGTLGESGIVEPRQDVSAENCAPAFSQADDSDAESEKNSERPKSREGATKDIDTVVTAAEQPQQQTHDPEKNDRNTKPQEYHNPVTKKQKWQSHLLTFLNDQWFLLTMGLLIILASQTQVPQSQQPLKSRIISYLCVCIIFFATGCTLDTSILIRNYARWKAHLWVQGQCFLLCSGIMFGVVSATALNRTFMDEGLLVGLVFMSCIPTTLATNVVMTGLAGGNQELAVVQVTLGNFIGVFITPALVIMYTSVPTWYNAVLPSSNAALFTEVYRRVLKQVGVSIYIPLFAGQIARYFFPNLCQKIFKQNPIMKRISSLAMLVIIWSTYDQAFASGAFDTVKASNKIFLVFILLAIWLVYLGISVTASLPLFEKKDIAAIAYCVTGKGPATGIPLSISIFEGLDLVLESKLQIPVVIYQSLSIGFGTMIIPVLRRWIARDERMSTGKV
ncbi:putative membrane protein [Cercospora beticola]|uniref:Putative membrane protein n=1 Tax=Cercospora beticola TaxID=122368 RepID=A0A2G5I1N7_CERBT|nr:putative membrane protein [Cercospora beticola]PIA98706.1 putative membrane protein [Cercospora beticola]WPA99408.1 hypothetical protein RHO25_004025 [Cercospora beticola]